MPGINFGGQFGVGGGTSRSIPYTYNIKKMIRNFPFPNVISSIAGIWDASAVKETRSDGTEIAGAPQMRSIIRNVRSDVSDGNEFGAISWASALNQLRAWGTAGDPDFKTVDYLVVASHGTPAGPQINGQVATDEFYSVAARALDGQKMLILAGCNIAGIAGSNPNDFDEWVRRATQNGITIAAPDFDLKEANAFDPTKQQIELADKTKQSGSWYVFSPTGIVMKYPSDGSPPTQVSRPALLPQP